MWNKSASNGVGTKNASSTERIARYRRSGIRRSPPPLDHKTRSQCDTAACVSRIPSAIGIALSTTVDIAFPGAGWGRLRKMPSVMGVFVMNDPVATLY